MEPPNEDCTRSMIEAHREMCRATGVFLAWVADHDRLQVFAASGARSEEKFLMRAFDIGYPTAHEWVLVANGLVRRPELRGALDAGEVSLEKLTSLIKLLSVDQPEVGTPPGPFDEPFTGSDPADPTDPDPSDPHASDPHASDPHASDPADPDASDPASDPGPADSSSDASSADSGTTGARELLDLIDRMSAGQLATQARRARQAAADATNARWRRRHCKLSGVHGEGRVGGTFEMYDDQAAIVRAAFDHYAANAGVDPSTGTYAPLDARNADALVAMALLYLESKTKTGGRPLVTFHADARLWAGEDGWAESSDYSPLAAETIRRLACSCHLGIIADDPDGRPLNMGRTLRIPNWQQTLAVLRRDGGGCRFCGMRFGVELHHILWWKRDGGVTNLGNLVAKCQICHHLVHEGGYTIEGDTNGELRLVAPDGTIVAATWPHPPQPPKRRPRTGPDKSDPPERRPPDPSPPDRPTAATAARPTRAGRPIRDARAAQSEQPHLPVS